MLEDTTSKLRHVCRYGVRTVGGLPLCAGTVFVL
jgi:hypothetical protein